MSTSRLAPMHVKIRHTTGTVLDLAAEKWTEEDLHHLDDAIAAACSDGTLAVPGLAHVRNKVAARLGKRMLLTTGEEPDRPWEG